jgi:DNA polymerase III subunit gamma/tau
MPAGSRPVPAPVAAAPAAPLVIQRFEDLIALAAQKRDLAMKTALERDLGLIRCEDGRLEIRLEPSASKTLVHELSRKLSQWTNRPWMVVVSAQEGQPTVKSQMQARQAELTNGARTDPLVKAVLARFPGAEIVDVRQRGEGIEQISGADEDAVAPELRPDDEASA